MAWESVAELVDDAWDWWTAGRLAAAAAVGALLAGALGTRAAVRTLDQTRRDSKERSRPMMAAELQRHDYADGVMLLIVRNYGPSVARNVRVSFKPELPDLDKSSHVTPYIVDRYRESIPVVTPGMVLSNIYFTKDFAKHGELEGHEPVPTDVTVTISYESEEGDPYSGMFPLSVSLLANETYATSSTAPESRLKEIAAELKRIRELLRRLNP